MNNEIKMPLSKTKLALMLVVALTFVIIRIWCWIYPEDLANSYYQRSSPLFISLVGLICIIFFGACTIFFLWKLFDTKYGLIINAEGIIDNSSGVSIGLIKWSDIIDIKTLKVKRQKFIVIEVEDPDMYIALAKTRLGKIALKENFRMSGSPININSNSLKSNFANLLESIETSYNQQLVKSNNYPLTTK